MKELYNGGGHPKAAGASIPSMAEDFIKSILKDRVNFVAKAG